MFRVDTFVCPIFTYVDEASHGDEDGTPLVLGLGHLICSRTQGEMYGLTYRYHEPRVEHTTTTIYFRSLITIQKEKLRQ
jgi:hypothetical protein